jgi:LruC domain-containing protein
MAQVYPNTDVDDGVTFLTPLIAGIDSLVEVKATGAGYLSIWADWDKNGEFSNDEKLVSDQFIDNTTVNILVNTPITAINGSTWTRSRFTSTQSILANGGVADGEVEDNNVTVFNYGFTQIQDTPYYLAFEDNWPEKGDYDMNDVVIYQESSLLLNSSNEVIQIELHGELKAYGASYRNGFAIQLDGVLPSNVDSSLVRFEINGVVQETSAIEIGTDNVVAFITDDIGSHIQLSNNCLYYRTEANCTNSNEMKFSVTIPFINAIDENAFPEAPYNPFIFAKEATYHGNLITQPGRELEIHLKNKLPTSKANETFFGQGDDVTNVSANETYQSNSGLPWALAISPGSGEEWKHPLETIDILQAYPKFEVFVESNGVSEKTWFSLSNAESSKLY